MVNLEGNQPTQNEEPQKSAPTDVKASPSPKALSRPDGHGLSPLGVGRPSKFNWLLASNIAKACQTRYLTEVLKDEGMPDIATVNKWMLEKPKFSQWITRSRTMFADFLAEKSASMFDEAPPMEKMATKNGVFERISMSGVQRERYKSQAMFNLAAKFNREKYGDSVNVQSTFDISVVLNAVDGKPMKQAKSV